MWPVLNLQPEGRGKAFYLVSQLLNIHLAPYPEVEVEKLLIRGFTGLF